MKPEPFVVLPEKQAFFTRFKAGNFFNSLAGSVSTGLTGDIKTSVKGALSIVKYETNVQHRAYELIFNALGTAAISLLQEEHRKIITGNLINKKGLFNLNIDKEIENLKLEVDPTFLADPKNFELVKSIRPAYKDWLLFLGLSEAVTQQLQRKLPHQFLLELTKEWHENSAYYQLILDKFKTPFYEAWKIEAYTLKYQDELREMVHEPAMGDELLPLSKIYIKPYFTIHDRSCGKELGERDKDGFVKELPIDETIHHYIEQRIIYNKQPLDLEVEKNNLIFLLGQPGQGKSSFCLYTLNQLLEHPDFEKQIYFVRLKDLSDTRELINRPFDSVKEYIKENHQLDFSEDNSVLILDGLDEIYQRDGLSDKELEGFYHKLEHRSERKKSLTIILTSRYNYLTVSAIGKKRTTILKLKGLRLEQQQEWLSTYISVHKDCTLSLDKVVEINHNAKLKHIKELIEQPILLHIIATAKIDINDSLNRSTIYKNLFDALITRSWDKKKGQPKKYENLEDYPDEFREWLQEIAFNIYKSDLESIQRQALLGLSSTKTIQSRLITSDDFKDAQKDLLVAFYFKNSKVGKKDPSIKDKEEYAIEFLHKSLQEYLAAEYIWNTIKKKTLEKDKRGKFVIDNFKEALKLFSDLFARKELNQSTRSLLIQMVESTNKEDKKALGDRLELFLPDCIEHQFLYKYDLSSDLTHLGNPFDKALNTFYGYWLILSHLGLNKNLLPIEHRSNFIHLIRKISLPINLNKINLAGANLIRAYLKGADLSGADLKRADLRRAILKGADLRKTDLGHTALRYTHLREANLREANLSGADLRQADLRQADLRETDLQETDLRETDLSKADLSVANLSRAILNGANLRGAILIQANLSGASLIQADLSGVNLRDADLIRADLRQADLIRADLIRADLSGADLSGADLSGADLRDANLRRADLRETDLNEANFSRANFSRANLIRTNLSGANLRQANFNRVDLREANLRDADLRDADLRDADLRDVNLRDANFSRADLRGTDLRDADLREADFSEAKINHTDFINQLTQWNCVGISEIENKYHVDTQNYYHNWDYNREQPYYLIKEKTLSQFS